MTTYSKGRMGNYTFQGKNGGLHIPKEEWRTIYSKGRMGDYIFQGKNGVLYIPREEWGLCWNMTNNTSEFRRSDKSSGPELSI